jgi:hypothetical protein
VTVTHLTLELAHAHAHPCPLCDAFVARASIAATPLSPSVPYRETRWVKSYDLLKIAKIHRFFNVMALRSTVEPWNAGLAGGG